MLGTGSYFIIRVTQECKVLATVLYLSMLMESLGLKNYLQSGLLGKWRNLRGRGKTAEELLPNC